MEFRFITVADALYPQELDLRYRVLREPLGHPRSEVTFPFEPESLHLVALHDAALLGCVLFHPESPRAGRLFQMAVDPAHQSHGLGTQLVRTLETELERRGYERVHLHARHLVVPFYERLGYTVHGAPFVEVSLAHRHMERTLR